MRTPADHQPFERVLRAPVLRARRWIVLVWLALVASWVNPLVHAESMRLVCSSAGHIQWIDVDSDALSVGLQHGKECALCLALEAPPPAATFGLPPQVETAEAVPVWHQPTLPVVAASPFKARAPPAIG